MTAQSPGPRERIFTNIAAQLATVMPENGYATEAGRNVFRLDLLTDQIGTRTPCLLLLESLSGEIYKAYDAYVYEVTMPVLIAGMVWVPTVDLLQAPTHQKVNELINDAQRALMEDPTFGGACKDSVLERTSTFVDVARGEGYFATIMHCTYHIERGVL